MNNLDSESLPSNPDPRPTAGSGVNPISESVAQIRQTSENQSAKGSSANDSGANPYSGYNLSEQAPPYPTIPQFSSLSLSPLDLKPMVTKMIVDLFNEGALPAFSSPSSPDPRMGVQLSQPAQAAVIPINYGLDVERRTNDAVASSMGLTQGNSQSKADTVQSLAESIYQKDHASGGDMKMSEAKKVAEKQYQDKEAEVSESLSLDKSRTGSVYGNTREEIENNLKDTHRLHGETGKQYENRRHEMDRINRISDPTLRKEALGKFVAEQLGDGYLPVALRRADGQHQTLAYLLSGVNIRADHGVTGTDGNDKPYSDYYATIPPFLGFSADSSRNYTVWFGDSNDKLFPTESVYQVSVNAPEDPGSQIVLDVGSKNIDGAPTIFINSSTEGDQAIIEPTKLTLKNSNYNYITLDTDHNELFMGSSGSSNQVYLNSDKLFLMNGSYRGSYESDQVILQNGDHILKLTIPDANAKWQTIEVCVNNVTKIMQVFGTEPIDPPSTK